MPLKKRSTKSSRVAAPNPKMTDADRRALSLKLGSILLYGTFGLLMFGPVAFGAVEPWSIFILEVGSTVLALLWLGKQWLDGEINIRWNPLFLPMGAFALLIVAQLAFRISAYPHDTVSQLLLFCAYAMLCFLSSQTLIRGSQARRLTLVFVIYGFAIAALALLQGISSNGKLYWIRQPRLGGWIYGPYVNHNHYAGLMELLLPIPLVLAFTRFVDSRERLIAGTAAAVMAGTVFLSGSRGGMFAILAEVIVLATVLIRQRRGAKLALAAGIFLLVLGSLLAWLGGNELIQRVSSISSEARTEISGGMRLSIDRDALHMFRVHPILGSGLGTFPVVYPQFRSFYTNFFVNEAHNDYLQLLTEVGLLGFSAMIWFLVLVYRAALRKITNWTADVTGGLTLACILGVTGILVHSFLDFNLEIPANAALFYVFCTQAAAPPLLQPFRKKRPIETSIPDLISTSEVS
jgi:O-antigen ligase